MICFVNINILELLWHWITIMIEFFSKFVFGNKIFLKTRHHFFWIWEGIENFHSRPFWMCWWISRAFPRNQKVCLLPICENSYRNKVSVETLLDWIRRASLNFFPSLYFVKKNQSFYYTPVCDRKLWHANYLYLNITFSIRTKVQLM